MPEAALNVVLLRHTPEPEEVVAMAAKLCYSPSGVEELKQKIEAKDQAAFVEKLASIGHLSPIEHVRSPSASRASPGPALISWSATAWRPIRSRASDM